MLKKYIVDLSDAEREALLKLVTTGKHAAYKINHARILLKADVNQPDGSWSDPAIAKAIDISIPTIERVRKRFVCEGLEAALGRQHSGGHPKRLDGESEAHLLAIACSKPPEGRGKWTLRLLADKMVELGYIEKISHETVRKTLKKTNSSPILLNLG